jgi:hypothetical protein
LVKLQIAGAPLLHVAREFVENPAFAGRHHHYHRNLKMTIRTDSAGLFWIAIPFFQLPPVTFD